jgi:hypothetical protein
MDSNRSISKAPRRTRAAKKATSGHRVFYIDPARKIDVMFDQLRYLVEHQRSDCPRGCQDCTRLRQIEDRLLQPFRNPANRPASTFPL